MKYFLVLLSLLLLLGLSACDRGETAEESVVEREREEVTLPEKTPIDGILDKLPPDSLSGKNAPTEEEGETESRDYTIEGLEKAQIELFPILTMPPEGEIPLPEPVEPPVEEQSETPPAEEQ